MEDDDAPRAERSSINTRADIRAVCAGVCQRLCATQESVVLPTRARTTVPDERMSVERACAADGVVVRANGAQQAAKGVRVRVHAPIKRACESKHFGLAAREEREA